jgi:hypothetical protein
MMCKKSQENWMKIAIQKTSIQNTSVGKVLEPQLPLRTQETKRQTMTTTIFISMALQTLSHRTRSQQLQK